MSIVTKIMWIMILVVCVGGSAFFGWLIYKARKYCDNVIILERIDSNDNKSQLIRRFDKGGIFKLRDGSRVYKLKKTKIKLGLDDYNFIMNDKKGRTTIILCHKQNYRFVKLNLLDDKVDISIAPEDVTNAISDFDRFSKAFTTQAWYEKMLPYLVPMVIGVIIVIIVAVFLMRAESIAANLASTEAALQSCHQATQLPGVTL